jgi:hypothetical protein
MARKHPPTQTPEEQFHHDLRTLIARALTRNGHPDRLLEILSLETTFLMVSIFRGEHAMPDFITEVLDTYCAQFRNAIWTTLREDDEEGLGTDLFVRA